MIVVTAPPLVTLKVKLPADERRAVQRAAEREGLSVSAWARRVLTNSVGK